MKKATPKVEVTPPKEASIVKELEPMTETKVTLSLPIIVIAVAIIIAGGFTGFALARGRSGTMISPGQSAKTAAGGLQKTVGLSLDKVGKDNAEGMLVEGGVDGEGSHHLERDGGPSQNVYLTSSVVPLDDYVGKKVKVWGETFAAAKAGWFMDVGRLELQE